MAKTEKQQAPSFYTCRLQHQTDGSTRRGGVWAYTPEQAVELLVMKYADYQRPSLEALSSRPFRWSDGRLLFAHVEQSEGAARHEADNYREESRRNRGQWSVRIFPRHVRAGDADIPCWAVVVRHKFEVPNR